MTRTVRKSRISSNDVPIVSSVKAEPVEPEVPQLSFIEQSPDISELAAAMSAFQAEHDVLKRDKQGYGYTYVTLDSVVRAIKPSFKKHGIAIFQFPVREGDRFGVVTQVTHKSGQWIRSAFTMKTPPLSSANSQTQKEGAAIGYARRYALCAVVGIAAEEDLDGQADVDQEEDDY